MKRILLSLLFSMLTFQYAHAIEIWHTNTSWVGHGMCSASFLIDSQGEEVMDLKLGLSAMDSDNNDVDDFMFNVQVLGDSNADMVVQELWESENACNDELKLKITLASALINNQEVDLIKANKISVRNLRLFEIQIAGRNAEDQMSNHTPSFQPQCAIPLGKEDADNIWHQMQKDIDAYYNQCVRVSAEMAMEFGGLTQPDAIKHGQGVCTQEIQEVNTCMGQPGAQPEFCICGSDI